MFRAQTILKTVQAYTSSHMAMLLAAMLAGLILISTPASTQERGAFKEGESAEDIAEDAQTDQLDFVFRQIASATNDGLENLIPILNGLLATLLIISLVLTFVFGAFQEDFSPFCNASQESCCRRLHPVLHQRMGFSQSRLAERCRADRPDRWQ